MNKHTPGPWHLEIPKVWNEAPKIMGPSNVEICRVATNGQRIDSEVNEGNAYLLAASLDLLKELKNELKKRCGKGPECEVCGGNGSTLPYHAECCARARAAIVKAEERQT